MARRLFGLILLAIIFVSFMEAEASVCETRSKEFRGICFRDNNCLSICEKEGFLSGKCKGFLLRCICSKTCDGATTASGATSGGGDGGSGADTGANPTMETTIY